MSKLGQGAFRPLASALKPIAEVLAQPAADKGAAEAYEASRRQGYDDGFEQGRAEGRAEGLAAAMRESDLAQQRQAAENRTVLEGIAQGVQEWQAAMERKLGLVAVRIAREALAGEEASGPAVQAIVRKALRSAEGAEVVRVRVPPEAASCLEDVPGLAVVADPSVDSGCIVETSWGELDARCSSYLDRVEKEAA